MVSRKKSLALFCAAGALVSALTALYGPFHWGEPRDGRNDFRAFYAGGRLAGTSRLYVPEAIYRVQEAETTPWGPADLETKRALVFIRLPWFALFLKPISLLPYLAAYRLWLALMLAALGVFLLLWDGDWRVKGPAVCCCLPAFRGIFSGQDVTLVLMWLGLSLYLWRRNRPFLAGLVLALCTAKFHLMILVPLVLLAQKRWRYTAGLAAGGALLFAASCLGMGWRWPHEFLRAIQDPRINAAPSRMPNLHLLAHGSLFIELLLAMTVALSVWSFARRSDSLEWGIALAFAGGVILAVHNDMQDCCLMLPAILLVAQRAAGWAAMLAIALASPVPWFWLLWQPPFPDATRGMLLLFVLSAAFSLRADWTREIPAAVPGAGEPRRMIA
ncbi:MAG TPA: glycosyltransferase family 87 protein [Bryobacteraceae bacterium]|jgi:hypothetical protein|nr:glycosyltransferase family 87 protein [Bryobacteraceae bacterium]